MQRYRTSRDTGPLDSPSLGIQESSFFGVNEYDAPENIPPGQAQEAVNVDFGAQDAGTRGGFVCIPTTDSTPFEHSWTSRTSAADNDWEAVAYGNGLYVAIANTGTGDRVMTSPDGITWTSRTSAADYAWEGIAFGNGVFVAVAASSAGLGTDRVMTSSDGISWTLRTTPANAWQSVCFGNGIFVAVGWTGAIMTSPTGVTWTLRTGPNSNDWQAVAYGNSLYVAVGITGTGTRVMTSPDGTTWTSRTSAADISWSGIAYGNGVYVATAITGTISNKVMTSPDGTTWTSRTVAEDNPWRDVAFGNGLFVAVANTGTNRVMTSRDGTTWTSRSAAAANNWLAVTHGSGLFVAVSVSGTGNRVMTSPDGTVWASGIYSDPDDPGSQWIMLVGRASVGFFAAGKTSRSVAIDSAQTVTEQSTIVQANNKVYIFRGPDSTPLVWDGSWANEFELATGNPPESTQAIYYQNRLWAIDGKDTLSASDVLDFTTWNNLDNSFNLSKGDSNFLVTTYPFGDTSMLVFKNRSILLLTGVDGALNDIVASEITRQVGAIGINAVVSVGPDVVYMSDRNINLITLTSTNNSVQHKTLPLSQNIQKIFARVNWTYAYKVSMGYNDNKLYVALPLDNSTTCNAVVVYNFITENWYGEWNFDSSIGMAIQGWAVATYLGLQRMHAVTEDGRIFVTDEGPADISGTTVAEISSSLTTRAYVVDNNNRVNRRMWVDISTWRPEFTITACVDGVSESSELISDQTYERSETWIFGDSTYSLTNSGDNYNRAGRKDYAGYCSDSIQCQSGFLPQAEQEYRLPLLFRRKGRLVWFTVANTQGRLTLAGIGSEAREGDRGNYTQII